jgi:hypothetical protein
MPADLLRRMAHRVLLDETVLRHPSAVDVARVRPRPELLPVRAVTGARVGARLAWLAAQPLRPEVCP